MLHPYPTSIQNPIDGAYNTLSAMTNPTGKKRFEAGKKGSIIIARLYANYCELLRVIKIRIQQCYAFKRMLLMHGFKAN